MRDNESITGGCQCGAVRYSAQGPGRFTVCHCRMCQRATGNLSAPLVAVARDSVTWQGTPATFASSNIAERGFCATCGTPIYYAGYGRAEIEFMAGSLSDGPAGPPEDNHGIESRYRWLDATATGGRETFFTEGETCHSNQIGPA